MQTYRAKSTRRFRRRQIKLLAAVAAAAAVVFIPWGRVGDRLASSYAKDILIADIMPAINDDGLTPANPINRYGISTGSSGLVNKTDDELAAWFDAVKELGVGWVRFDIDWSIIQDGGPNKFDWEEFDRLVIAAAKRQLGIVGIIDYSPIWARDPACAQTALCPPRHSEAYAKFAGQAVQRFKGSINHWEIWNEPNNSQFWKSGADPSRYTQLLKLAYIQIKAKDPAAMVITAGLSPQPNDRMNKAPIEFLKGVYEAGGRGYFDAVGHHPYTFPAIPSHGTRHAWDQMVDAADSLRSVMEAYGDADKQIWITEFGAPTGGPGETARIDNFASVRDVWHVDDDLQTRMVEDALNLYKTYDWAGPFFWYSLQDAGTKPDTNENFFGLIRADGSRKPAYDSFKRLIKD